MSDSRIPFGIPGLDNRFRGIPEGSFVLLTGEVDSGVDEYAYTSASMIAMAKHMPKRYRRYNSEGGDPDTVPEDVHYISLERRQELVDQKFRAVLNGPRYKCLTENMIFKDVSDNYLSLMESSHSSESYSDLLDDLYSYLEENASDSLVIIDSLTSLRKATEFGLEWSDVLNFLTKLTNDSFDWNGLVYMIYHGVPSDVRDNESLASTPDGILYFSISEIGGGYHRSMYVGSFRGTLSQTQKQILVYDTKISAKGFEVSTVREIV